MPGNSIGERFRVTSFGESHGGGVGVVVDGCPSGHRFPHERIAAQLARRRPGQPLTSQRAEPDAIEVLSGIAPEGGLTLGTPIAMMVRNVAAKASDYDELHRVYRPSHADFTYDARFGLRFVEGGGRASARETVARVAAGALAEDVLATHGIEVIAWVERIGEVVAPPPDEPRLTRAAVDATVVRCPDIDAAAAMTACVEQARKAGDTVGGVIRALVRGVPAGLGEPVFDKLSATLAHAMMSLPASRGFELGEGFAAATMRGSVHNDAFVPAPQRAPAPPVATRTNHSGGIQGGISNGETIRFAVAFKPVATIFVEQDTVTREGEATRYRARGRHDPCVVPRAVPMVEAMAAIVVLDALLRRQGVRAQELVR